MTEGSGTGGSARVYGRCHRSQNRLRYGPYSPAAESRGRNDERAGAARCGDPIYAPETEAPRCIRSATRQQETPKLPVSSINVVKTASVFLKIRIFEVLTFSQ